MLRIKKSIMFFIVLIAIVACSDKEPAVVNNVVSNSHEKILLDVYKDPSCGCCADWITHAEKYDFLGKVHHPEDLNLLKNKYGITPKLQSCHTSVSASGYVFEGHVPAKLIQQFLEQPPANAIGLTVPGMPMESPGMEMGGTFTPYDVLLINKDGTTRIYAHMGEPQDQY